MAADINKATHLGTALTNPTMTTIGGNTSCAIFTLRVMETWIDKTGNEQSRPNSLKFEALGPKSHWVKANVRVGKRFIIDSYFRSEVINGKIDDKFRIFHIEQVRDSEYQNGRIEGRREALKQVLGIVDSSKDLIIVKAKLEVLLDNL